MSWLLVILSRMLIIKKTKNNSLFGRTDPGFTLLELMVGASIFLVIVAVVIGVVFSSIKTQRASIQFQNVVDNSRFAMESMSRAIRMSDVTDPTLGNVDGVTSTLSINHPRPALGRVEYSWDGTTIFEKISGSNVPMTGSNTKIEDFSFTLTGFTPNDDIQPRITIRMRAKQPAALTRAQDTEEIILQTTVSPRGLDL